MSDSDYLTNQLLIAMPMMGDPNFAQTVALICEHSADGALGLILNKPLPMRMSEIFEQLEIELPKGELSGRQVLRGGPMQTDRGFVVHRGLRTMGLDAPPSPTRSTSPPRGISSRPWRAARDRLKRWSRSAMPDGTGGQLEDEIRANAWLSAPVDSSLIFDMPFEVALARGRAAVGRRAIAHQSDQR
jgi:putative transcriptional regulator